ncbi:mammalian cell entry protein [Mycobacterium sp.]|uniref:mammalian cell entry protein n=1 Tax=Mycobacterium sp. TaxID=1785 RepID=UPI002CE219CB|nr:mammalian cell entry protein [Mycobacterium sp.]HME48658.1 mammalian cell entry protein [Mycobacterium sp.]
MSPRRRIDPATEDAIAEPKPKRPLRWRLPVLSTAAALLIAGAIAASTLMLVSHETDRRQSIKDSAVLGYVRSFMTEYTTLDPFHANDYADRILAEGTGDFAKLFKQRENEILITVARAEPTTGSVMEAGVSRWNDDGSADVLVATKIVTTGGPDGKTVIESGNRWLATAIKEGQQWKIDRLVQVI